jgi:hypothetical protein
MLIVKRGVWLVRPLTYAEIGNFLQSVLFGFDEYIVFAYVLMCVTALALSVKKLLVWGS